MSVSIPAFDPNSASPPGSGLFGLPYTLDEATIVVVPVPWDATTSYRAGTSLGPAAILEASKQVDLFDLETGRPYEAMIAMLDIPADIQEWNEEARRLAVPIIERGGATDEDEELVRVNAFSEQVNEYVYNTCKSLLAKGKTPVVLGGDHSCPFGAIRAYAEVGELGVLHIDAHADLRDAYEGFEWSHASIMDNVLRKIPGVTKLVQIGIRDFSEAEYDRIHREKDRVRTLFDLELATARRKGTLEDVLRNAIEALPKRVYVSFDIDGLDPRFCPSTGTPVPGGLDFYEASLALKLIVESGRQIVGCDLNEVAPDPNGTTEWDANVGARVLYKMIGWMIQSKKTKQR